MFVNFKKVHEFVICPRVNKKFMNMVNVHDFKKIMNLKNVCGSEKCLCISEKFVDF